MNILKNIKSPLNYTGGKARLLDQILPNFPSQVNNFIDLFAGGCNIGINANAKKIFCNDIMSYLIEMYKAFQINNIETTIEHIENQIKHYNLSITNEEGYKQIRKLYNEKKNPLDLFVLIAFSFNHQIRFNNKHDFNNPFGRDRSCFNNVMKQNLENFIYRIKELNICFTNFCFNNYDISKLNENDFVYCDPPYLITTGTYNDGKRGFKGWTDKEENELLKLLKKLDENNIKFALSNVLDHKGKSNDILKKWLDKNPNYNINYLKFNYSNSNYQTIVKDKNASTEVLITNYKPIIQKKEHLLF
jgi:DNA adenine methylase